MRVDPVKEILSTALSVRAIPVSGSPVTVVKISANGATSVKLDARYAPTPGVYSLGLKTTVLPAASA